MKKLLNGFGAMKVVAVLTMGAVYYLAVPPEHQIFKFLALAFLVGLFGELCRQGEVSETKKDPTIIINFEGTISSKDVADAFMTEMKNEGGL